MKKYEQEIEILIRAGAKVIEVASYEWQRVHGFINEVCLDLNMEWYTWSSVYGIKKWVGNQLKEIAPDIVTLPQALDFYIEAEDNMILLLEDFHPYSDVASPVNVRYIREMMRGDNYKKPQYKKAIILSSPSKYVPEELSKELPVIQIELPDRDALAIIAEDAVREFSKECLVQKITPKLLESALGLTVMEAKLAFAKAIMTKRQLTENEIPIIISEKEQIIKKSGLLEYYHNNSDLESIGGLDNLKSWIKKRGNAFLDRAKEFGLSTPRGILLLGVPGCGKSLTAKAIANEWKFPLLRFDIGKVYGGMVGESEKNIRYALDVAKTISPCVLWIDEIEKGLSGYGSSNRSDGGTSARVFGTFLTWMQEKKEPVFVVATANDISQIPPELLRKGRFDEIFFVDLPSNEERKSIFNIHLNNKGRSVEKLGFSIDNLVKNSEGYSGAEIEESINEAMFVAFDNNQSDITEQDIINCLKSTCPLSKTMYETICDLRKWAKERARFASSELPQDIEKVEVDTPILEQEYNNPFIRSK